MYEFTGMVKHLIYKTLAFIRRVSSLGYKSWWLHLIIIINVTSHTTRNFFNNVNEIILSARVTTLQLWMHIAIYILVLAFIKQTKISDTHRQRKQGARRAMAPLNFKDSQDCNFYNRKSLQFSKVAPLLSVASSASADTW